MTREPECRTINEFCTGTGQVGLQGTSNSQKSQRNALHPLGWRLVSSKSCLEVAMKAFHQPIGLGVICGREKSSRPKQVDKLGKEG